MTKQVMLTIDGTSGSPELEEAVALVFQEYLEMWKVKQRKYGPQNIASMGKPGLIIRMNDKYQRLKRFVFEDIGEDKEGSQEDAWLDMLGYSVIGVVVHRGLWPKVSSGGVSWGQVIFLFKKWLGGLWNLKS